MNKLHRLHGTAFGFPGRRQEGLSLVELMVGLAVGLVISLGLFALVTNTSRSFKVQDDFSRLQDNGTTALRYIVDDIRMAGFYGLAANTQSTIQGATTLAAAGITTVSPDCGTADATTGLPWAMDFSQPVVVFGSAAGGALTQATVNSVLPCIQGADFAEGNGSVFVLRGALGFQVRDANNDNNLADDLALQPNYTTTIYVQSSPNQDPNTVVFQGDRFAPLKASGLTRTLSTGADAPIFEYQSHVYYVRPCSRPTPPATTCAAALNDDGGRSIPTLVRHELVGSAMQLVPLVEGIERINLLYGIDSDNDGVAEQYMTGAQFAAGLVASPQTADWRWVVSVRVSVLARGITASPGYNDANKVYDLGGGVVFACTPGTNCDFKRHVFTQIASVRNCAQRRSMGNPC